MTRPTPTFEKCPECDGIVIDFGGHSVWCSSCSWSMIQRALGFDPSPTGEDYGSLLSRLVRWPYPPPYFEEIESPRVSSGAEAGVPQIPATTKQRR